nr:hypothetical protein [uncultured Caproiciproducens sp.]
MEINENNLYQIILKVIQKMQAENIIQNFSVPDYKMYVVLTGGWKEDFRAFFENLKNQYEYQIFTVIPPSMANDYYMKKLKECRACGTIVKQSEINFELLSDALTVFPVVSRELVVKTALCISDTFETKWIQSCMANGQKIVLLKSGLEPFTGKEPKAYVRRIQEYYKTIEEYGIEIKNDISKEEPICTDCDKTDIQPQQIHHTDAGQKVITESEIDQFTQNRRIVLHHGDIMTALAKEKAFRLGIEILRQ